MPLSSSIHSRDGDCRKFRLSRASELLAAGAEFTDSQISPPPEDIAADAFNASLASPATEFRRLDWTRVSDSEHGRDYIASKCSYLTSYCISFLPTAEFSMPQSRRADCKALPSHCLIALLPSPPARCQQIQRRSSQLSPN